MIHDAGVKSIAMGGRPSKSKIQGMGGVKGAQSFGWADIYSNAQAALEYATPAQATILKKLTQLPIQRSSSNSVNLRDLITPDHINDGVPAQFVAEEADCRLYYEEAMITDVTKLWQKVAKTAWGGGKCVAGSLGHYKRNTEEIVAESNVENKREAAVIPDSVFVGRTEGAKKPLSSKFGKKVIA
jgi:hypothetical protein